MKKMNALFTLKLSLFTAIFVFAACSSGPKKEEKKAHNHAEKTAAAVESKAEEVKSSVKEHAHAASEMKGESMAAMTCKLGADVRKLDITKVGDNGCELYYTKNGSSEKVGWADNTATWCDEMSRKIQSTLEVSGFKCE